MKIYNINFRKFVRQKIPTFLRKSEILLCILDAIAQMFVVMYKSFTDYCNEVKRMQKYNFQVCYLEAMLNDTFDAAQRRIYITNMVVRQFLMIYAKEEDRPAMINQVGQGTPVMINRLEEIESNNTFIVNIPQEIENQTDKLRASVDVYRLASREFVIRTF